MDGLAHLPEAMLDDDILYIGAATSLLLATSSPRQALRAKSAGQMLQHPSITEGPY